MIARMRNRLLHLSILIYLKHQSVAGLLAKDHIDAGGGLTECADAGFCGIEILGCLDPTQMAAGVSPEQIKRGNHRGTPTVVIQLLCQLLVKFKYLIEGIGDKRGEPVIGHQVCT